jgi:hypothetical protein
MALNRFQFILTSRTLAWAASTADCACSIVCMSKFNIAAQENELCL